MPAKNTTLWIKHNTHTQLKKMCPKGQTYDDFIQELMSVYLIYNRLSDKTT